MNVAERFAIGKMKNFLVYFALCVGWVVVAIIALPALLFFWPIVLFFAVYSDMFFENKHPTVNTVALAIGITVIFTTLFILNWLYLESLIGGMFGGMQ